MRALILVLALTGCAYGNEYRPEARTAAVCITSDPASGTELAHTCDPSDPWVDVSSGLDCTRAPVQVGAACTFNGQLGTAED